MADANVLFEQLKSKYQTVLNKMDQLGVRLQNLHIHDNKLVLRGQAPTQADSNAVWDQIKQVDPNYQNDLMAEIGYDTAATASSTPQATMAASAGTATSSRSYTVKSGDTLSKIAKEIYGDASQYMRIFEANRDKLADPNRIQVGQVLNIP